MRYENCRFCGGRGCLACEGEIRKAEKIRTQQIRDYVPPTEEDKLRALPFVKACVPSDISDEDILSKIGVPTPMLTINRDDPEGMDVLKKIIGSLTSFTASEAVAMDDIHSQCEAYRIRQQLR